MICDLVSVIVPVYNTEKYLSACLDSILNQTYTNMQIILVNDGSTDGSGSILDEYKEKDPRIIVIHKENGGVSSARNEGLRHVQGKYIFFIDSDDTVDPRYIELLLAPLEREDYDIVFCGYETVDIKLGLTKQHIPDQTFQGTMTKDLKLFFITRLAMLVGGPYLKFYNTEIIKKYNLCFDESLYIAEDWVFNLHYFLHIKKFYVIADSLYKYIHHGRGSATEEYSKRRIWGAIYALAEVKKILLNHDTCNKVENAEAILSYRICEIISSISQMRKLNMGVVASYRNSRILLNYIRGNIGGKYNTFFFKQAIVLKFLNVGFYLPIFIYYFFYKGRKI